VILATKLQTDVDKLVAVNQGQNSVILTIYFLLHILFYRYVNLQNYMTRSFKNAIILIHLIQCHIIFWLIETGICYGRGSTSVDSNEPEELLASFVIRTHLLLISMTLGQQGGIDLGLLNPANGHPRLL
jgi:hypothetical protein